MKRTNKTNRTYTNSEVPENLDHIFVTPNLGERISNTVVTGFSLMLNCEQMGIPPKAYKNLSDHCPVIIELTDNNH